MPRKQIFCKVEPDFIRNDPRYLSLSPNARHVYRDLWVRAFDVRSEHLLFDDSLVAALVLTTGRPMKEVSKCLQEIIKADALLKLEGGVLKVTGIKQKHRNIRFDETKVTQACRVSADKTGTQNKNKNKNEKKKPLSPTATKLFYEVWKEERGTDPAPARSQKTATLLKTAFEDGFKSNEILFRVAVKKFLHDNDRFIVNSGHSPVRFYENYPKYGRSTGSSEPDRLAKKVD